MPDVSGEKRDRWEKLNSLPDSVMMQCIQLVKEIEKSSTHDIFRVLAECDRDDISRLANSPKGSISKTYNQVISEIDREDTIASIRRLLTDTPIVTSGQLTGTMDGIKYRIKSCGERLEKSKFVDRRLNLPYRVTLIYGEDSVTIERVFEKLIGERSPENHVLEIHKDLPLVALTWLERGCKHQDILAGPGMTWKDHTLEIIHLLRDHPVGHQFMRDTQQATSFDDVFSSFPSHLLPYAKEVMSWHLKFSQCIEHMNSVAFVFSDNAFVAFTERDGRYIADNTFTRSPLYDQLEKAARISQ